MSGLVFTAARSSLLTRTARHVAIAGVGYALGTVPSADLASRLFAGDDPRTAGSGNPGAANVASVIGPAAGFVVLFADIAKGATAGRFGLRWGGAAGADLASTAAVVGHCYPVWSGFRGGKGVATSVGQVLATLPAYFPIDVGVAVATSAFPWWRQRAFAATMSASSAWVVGALVWWRRGLPNAWGPTPGPTLPLAALVSSAVICRRFIEGVRT